jgi:C_GCAxxG_C_C family probable redox protein
MTSTKKESAADQAAAMFHQGYNCAESVLLAATSGLNAESPLLPRLASGFGGGVSRCQLLCGALSGAVMAIGLKFGRDTAADPRDPAYTRVRGLLAGFQDRFGALDCRTLTGYDFADPVQAAENGERVHNEVCTAYVRFAAAEAEKLLTGKG